MIDAIDTETQNLQRMWDRFSDASASGVSGAKTEQSAKKVIKEVTSLLASDSNVRVKTANAAQTEPGQVSGRTGSPELDEPASRTNMNMNLEKLLLYLQLDNDERQVELAETRLETEKTALEKKHAQEALQIKENIAAQDEAAKSQRLMKVLGWAMVGVTVALAFVSGGVAIAAMGAATAAAAAAGGTTAGVAVGTTAGVTGTTVGVTTGTTVGVTTGTTVGVTTGTTVGTSVGTEVATEAALQGMQIAAKKAVTNAVRMAVMAAMGTGFMTLNETGVTEKVTNAIKDSLMAKGASERKASIWSTVFVALGQLGATIGGGLAAGGVANVGQGLNSLMNSLGKTAFNSLANTGREVLQSSGKFLAVTMSAKFSVGMQIGTIVMSSSSIAGQMVSAKAGYKSSMAQADTTELNAVLQKLQQMMDETNEELNQLLTQVQNIFGTMAGVIDSSMETEKEIATNLGNMA